MTDFEKLIASFTTRLEQIETAVGEIKERLSTHAEVISRFDLICQSHTKSFVRHRDMIDAQGGQQGEIMQMLKSLSAALHQSRKNWDRFEGNVLAEIFGKESNESKGSLQSGADRGVLGSGRQEEQLSGAERKATAQDRTGNRSGSFNLDAIAEAMRTAIRSELERYQKDREGTVQNDLSGDRSPGDV